MVESCFCPGLDRVVVLCCETSCLHCTFVTSVWFSSVPHTSSVSSCVQIPAPEIYTISAMQFFLRFRIRHRVSRGTRSSRNTRLDTLPVISPHPFSLIFLKAHSHRKCFKQNMNILLPIRSVHSIASNIKERKSVRKHAFASCVNWA